MDPMRCLLQHVIFKALFDTDDRSETMRAT